VNISRRLVIFVCFVSIILIAGIFYWPFILHEIIAPTSLGVWVLLRIFVLSIDQKYYWAAMILISSFFLCLRLLPRVPPDIQSEGFRETNATMSSIGYWHILFTETGRKIQDDRILKRELADLLLSLYATNQRTTADFRLYDALQRGQIPLPEHIHTLLFTEEPQVSKQFIRRLLHSIKKAPRQWVRRWTGQERAEHQRAIDELLCFMETSLEIKNDERKSTPNNH
jgi:hypothetical protein